MPRSAFSNVSASVILCASLTLAPLAARAAVFAGPAGWTRVDVASPQPTRTISQWHIAGDTSTSITFIQDSTQTYADTLAAMAKNFSDNGIKLATNKDLTCLGGTAHEVEFTSGPEGSRTIFNRLVIAQAGGVATLTYTRVEGNPFDSDVQKAENLFCAGPPDLSSAPPPPAASTPPPVAAPVPSPTST